ncbi:MAG: serine/threonine protein kinase, partial [Candidatus Obscuribacterales bacterium]|nr:serine/threonine protein kinase [Candidatus Obscuribacterales bacterium]
PAALRWGFLGRRNRSWHALKSVGLKQSSLNTSKEGSPETDDLSKYKLVLYYKNSGSFDLDLRYLSVADIEQLILGIDTFAESAESHSSLDLLKSLVKTKQAVAGNLSYTNLWEDELRYRYTSTTFIPLAPGATLQNGQIKIIRQLGFGGLSAIYLVQRNKTELAILKESVLPSDVDDRLRLKAEEQFAREAKLLAGLNHPKIAKVLDHFVERGHYLLLEYIHGKDLRQLITESGKLPETKVLEYGLQIADILDYLHKREPSIIHRDLSPENLILDEKGIVRLIDFGAANEFLHTATGTLVGKHAYMSPEQLKGKATTQSDLYSFGGTLYFLLTGKDPIPLVASHPNIEDATVSTECDELISKLTQLSTENRFHSAAEVKRAIASVLARSANL